jgi:hypothetical protein
MVEVVCWKAYLRCRVVGKYISLYIYDYLGKGFLLASDSFLKEGITGEVTESCLDLCKLQLSNWVQ